MRATRTLFESGHIQVLEGTGDDGEVQRHLLLGPPFQNPQGIIKPDKPKFHVQPFSRNLTYGALLIPGEVKNVLFLGLGAGLVVQAIRDLHPAATIDIVDLDAELFSVSNEFFFSIDAPNVHWFAEDASNFVRNADKRYDYICCDIWGDHLQVPEFLTEYSFIQTVRRILSEHGVFAISTNKLLHAHMSGMMVHEFKTVFSILAPTCLLIGMNGSPRLVSDPQVTAQLLANNLDVNAIRESSMLIRLARADDVRGHIA
jgi:spermidine synthase